MVLQRWYRFFGYLTLALSCACLIQAEMVLLPGMQLCLPPLLLLIVLAHGVEGRWALSVRGANLLGLLIVVGTTTWLYLELNDPESWVSQLPRPTGLIPLVGPVALCLLVVKLFRPRTPRDFWLLQGLGLLQVGLGCLITGDMPFALLLAAYFFSALACLTLHYHGREQAPAGASASVVRLLMTALRCFALVAPVSLLFFLLTPRIGKTSWKPVGRYTGSGSVTPLQTGMITEIDLNHVGAVYLDEEIALTVTFNDASGQPRNDLPADQHWRATVLERYEAGMWRPMGRRAPVTHPQEQLPDLGPEQAFIDFKVRPRDSGGLLLAEPLCFGPAGRRLPVIMQPPFDPKKPVFGETLGTILPGTHDRRREYHYRQVLPGTGTLSARSTAPDSLYVEVLKRQQVPGLREWAWALLRRLARERRHGLPEAALARGDPEADLPPEQWESAARALSDYLASSGEYTYSLELRRHDLRLDPVMDFLQNLKEGHCERYATALALLLRSLGIPARIVKGYRGGERQDEGVYVIRHSHAHSWVEALVPRDPGSDSELSWLTLDPTPGIEANRRASFSLSRWWFNTRNAAEIFWREMVVRYNAEQQADLWDAVLSRSYASVLALGGLVVAALGALTFLARRLPSWLRLRRGPLRRRRERSGHSRDGRICLAFYVRLLSLLELHLRLRPRPAQTPRELALAAGERLRELSLAPSLADVPARVAEVFYRVRFGDRPLAAEEEHGLGQQLAQLAAALRGLVPKASGR